MYNTVILKITIHTRSNTYSPYITKGLQNTRTAKQNKRLQLLLEHPTYSSPVPGGVYPHLHLFLLTPYITDDHYKSRKHTEHTTQKG